MPSNGEFNFVEAEFLNEQGDRQKVNIDPIARISEIDMEISNSRSRHAAAASSYEEREVERTIKELQKERAEVLAQLSDDQRESLPAS